MTNLGVQCVGSCCIRECYGFLKICAFDNAILGYQHLKPFLEKVGIPMNTPSPFRQSIAKKNINQVDINNALKIMRPTLGNDAGVALFRLVRLVALEDSFGKGASAMAYYAGKKLGASLGLGSLEEFLELCATLKVGIIEVPFMSEERIHVDVRECVTCSGLDKVGRPLCHLEGGLIVGVVESLFERKAKAVEVTCIGGLGDETCGFDIDFIKSARKGS